MLPVCSQLIYCLFGVLFKRGATSGAEPVLSSSKLNEWCYITNLEYRCELKGDSKSVLNS